MQTSNLKKNMAGKDMTKGNPLKLIFLYSMPLLVGNIVQQLYNMADTFFVSQINTSASAAVGIIYALSAIIQAFAFMIGMGSGIV